MLGIQIDYGFNTCQEWLLKKLMQLEAGNPVMSGTAENAWEREEVFRPHEWSVMCSVGPGRVE